MHDPDHPPRAAPIPFARPWIGEREAPAIARVLGSRWLTQGPEVAAFEKELASAVGARFAVAVSSGTAALHLALLVLGVAPGDEVVTPSHTFIATANAIRHAGAVPVFVDIEPATLNLDPRGIEPAITPRTRAIVCVHQLGMPADLVRILEIARRRGLAVIEDAACALGSEISWEGGWERIGRPMGDLATFSFHPRKIVTTGEGGAITTDREDFDGRLRLWRHQGMTISDLERHEAREVVLESYEVAGYNYRMSDIHAALGRVQLARLDEMVEGRRELGRRYRELLRRIPEVRPQEEPAWARSNFQSFAVRLPAGADLRRIMARMKEHGVSTRPGVMCAHLEAPYRDRAHGGLEASERARDGTILLPLFHELAPADQERVVRALEQALRDAGAA